MARKQPDRSGKKQGNDGNNGFAVVSIERGTPYDQNHDQPKKKACHPVK
jgi:hypothetical protein